MESLSNNDGDVNENGTTVIGLECVPLGWSVSGSVIGDHSDRARSNEAMNPLWTRIRRFIWSTWSERITDPDSDRPKETHPYIGKITTLHVHHAFLYISLPSLHDYDVKLPNFTYCGGREHKTVTFFFFPELRYCPLEFNSRKNCQHLTNWTRWNKRDKVWSSATSLCKWRFRGRRCRCCLSFLSVSLSKDFSQRLTSTGSGLSALLSSGFA